MALASKLSNQKQTVSNVVVAYKCILVGRADFSEFLDLFRGLL